MEDVLAASAVDARVERKRLEANGAVLAHVCRVRRVVRLGLAKKVAQRESGARVPTPAVASRRPRAPNVFRNGTRQFARHQFDIFRVFTVVIVAMVGHDHFHQQAKSLRRHLSVFSRTTNPQMIFFMKKKPDCYTLRLTVMSTPGRGNTSSHSNAVDRHGPELLTIKDDSEWVHGRRALCIAAAAVTIVWLSYELSKTKRARDAFLFGARVFSVVLIALVMVGQLVCIATHNPCICLMLSIGTWVCILMFCVTAVSVAIVAENAPVDQFLFPLFAGMLVLLHALTYGKRGDQEVSVR